MKTRKPKKDIFTRDGVITKALPNARFQVQLEDGNVIIAYICGKMKMNYVRLIEGDRVGVEITTYDLTNGRIVVRYRNPQ